MHSDEVRQPCAARVELCERSPRTVEEAPWDQFAQACDASFLGSWGVIAARRLIQRVRIFEFIARRDGQPVKIGQCAVGVRRRHVQFLDRIHLLPEEGHLWERCARLVVDRCGDARYEYGSAWNHEDRRGFSVTAPALVEQRPFQLDRIDFSRWSGFDDYRRQVSENIRRDYRKAAAQSVTVVRRRGRAALRDLTALVRLRHEVLRRNGERFSGAADYGLHALKLACLGDRAFIATARSGDRCQAAFFGVEFGDNIYYVAGGTARDSNGAGSYMFLTLLEEWFSTHPHGRLYLGAQVAGLEPSAYTRGNLLYRRKLRATQVEGTAFTLALAGAGR